MKFSSFGTTVTVFFTAMAGRASAAPGTITCVNENPISGQTLLVGNNLNWNGNAPSNYAAYISINEPTLGGALSSNQAIIDTVTFNYVQLSMQYNTDDGAAYYYSQIDNNNGWITLCTPSAFVYTLTECAETVQHDYTCSPTSSPSPTPTIAPTRSPTRIPTFRPSTFRPTTRLPTTRPTTRSPTFVPTISPSTEHPTVPPSYTPSEPPTSHPTALPTASPTAHPSAFPTSKPAAAPTVHPSAFPTSKPSAIPSITPTNNIASPNPSFSPTQVPSPLNSGEPTMARYPTVEKNTTASTSSSKSENTDFFATPAIQAAASVVGSLFIGVSTFFAVKKCLQSDENAKLQENLLRSETHAHTV